MWDQFSKVSLSFSWLIASIVVVWTLFALSPRILTEISLIISVTIRLSNVFLAYWFWFPKISRQSLSSFFNCSIWNFAKSLNLVMNICQDSFCHICIVFEVFVEENPHYFVEKQELFLKSLQIFLVFKVLSFYFSEHKFYVLICKIFTQGYYHKLPEWTNSLRRMFCKKFA